MQKTYLSIAAAALISIAGATAGFAAELPTFEAKGLPISAAQVGVLGAANVREQSPVLDRHSLAASTQRPDTADDTDGRDGRANPDHRPRHSLTDISIAA